MPFPSAVSKDHAQQAEGRAPCAALPALVALALLLAADAKAAAPGARPNAPAQRSVGANAAGAGADAAKKVVNEAFPASAESSFAVLTDPPASADLLATLPAIPPGETRCLATFRAYLDLDGRALSASVVPIQVVDGETQLITATQVQNNSPQPEGKASLTVPLGPLARGAYGGQVTAVVRFVSGQAFRLGCRLATTTGAQGPSVFRCDVSYVCL